MFWITQFLFATLPSYKLLFVIIIINAKGIGIYFVPED